MWWNLDRAGRPDDRLLHCGEPVQTLTPIPQRSNEPRTWLRGSMAQRAPSSLHSLPLPTSCRRAFLPAGPAQVVRKTGAVGGFVLRV